MTVTQHCRCGEITSVVVEQIFPNEQIEVAPSELGNWIEEYGNMVHPVTKKSIRLLGVRFADSPHIVSYAGCYWYRSDDHKWTTWHVYVGASRTPAMRVDRN